MILSYNFQREFKPIFLTVLLHLALLASLFSLSSVSVDISNYSSAGSFNMMSFSDPNPGISEKTVIQKKTTPQTSQNISSNNNSNNSDSSSEIIYEAKNLGNPQPQYPTLAKRRGEEGTVLIRTFVDENGNAFNVEVFKSSSFSSLDNAALEAIKKWHFIPAKKFGQFISSSVIIPINFKLTQNL